LLKSKLFPSLGEETRLRAKLFEKKSMGGEMSFWPLVRSHHFFTSLFSHPGDKFQVTIVVLEVLNYGEPSQSTKPAITCLQFQPINPRHKVCGSYSVTRCEG
jgi:hypothetical protein